MINLLVKISNWKFILSAFLSVVFFLYLFQSGQDAMNEIAGEVVPMIDVRQSYNLEEVKDFFTKLGEEGRAIHQQLTGGTDMLFPFSYGLFLILLLAFVIKKIFGSTSKMLYLSLFPIVLMGVDYLENMNTLALLDNFPNLTTALVDKGSQLTSLKQILLLINYGLIGFGGIVWLVKWISNRKKEI